MTNTTRIAKNTFILYIRMCIMMLISLYTSRLVLAALGVEDYGIYNVVGGFVAMFTMISGALSAAISRFITFELGKPDKSKLPAIFSTSVNVQIIISLIVLLLAETIGLWFLNEKLVIPEARLNAANWIYQFSVFSFIVHLLVVPFSANVIAHEKMSTFAYISIIDSLAKLLIAIIISVSSNDRLVFYGILLLVATTSTQSLYIIYCYRHYPECKYRLGLNKLLLKNIFSFAGWNFIGSISSILRDQGGNVLLNLFCGPTINAARGVALQVSGAVSGLVGNFTTALNPQITKTYAANELKEMRRLLYLGARFSFYVMLISSIPIIFNTKYLLDLWLKDVPPHTALFVQLVLVFALSETLSMALITAQLATGKIKKYQIVVGGLNMLNLPFAYVALKIGLIPESVVIVSILFSQVCYFARIIMLKEMIGLDLKDYLTRVYLNLAIVTTVSVIINGIVYLTILSSINNPFMHFVISVITCIVLTGFCVFFMGMNHYERGVLKRKTKEFIHRMNI